ncbi:MAG: hypothetical protein ACD_73C00029G0001 [uncultured bacterium]|nr:MAG: hypothetical protein ACD_73C00029G0001 [uncultured bacterium]
MNMNQILKQAQAMQKKMQKQQEELATKEYEATSGGGMVTAKLNGKGEILSLKIDPEVVSKEDVEMLQDLICAAVNEALRRVQEAQQSGMSEMMAGAGLKIPGLF